jgi:hypothetical protein
MNIKQDQEHSFKKLQIKLDLISCIQKCYHFGKSEYADDLEDRDNLHIVCLHTLLLIECRSQEV